MVDAQKYLDENYSNKEITELDLSNQNLEGELVIQDFPALEKIKCGNNKGLASIKLVNLPELDYFHANNCQLTNVEINNCPEITYFNVANNLLSELNFLNGLNFPEKLITLSIHTNGFLEKSLEPFRKFTNLQQLFLDNNDEEKFKRGEYNRFSGSLNPLKDCKKLELLSIGNTNISEGLEYLPESFRKIGLDASWQEKTAGCLKIRQELVEAVQFLEKAEPIIDEWNNWNKKETEKEIEIPEISEEDKKLKIREEGDQKWFNNYYCVAPWRKERKLQELEKGRMGQKLFKWWLDKNYPKNDVCQRLDDKENFKKNKREEIKKLSIRNLGFWGLFKIEGFISLQELDCSSNQFTGLDLSDFRRLTKLDCSNNKLANLDFLNDEEEVGLHYPQRLEELKISGNNFKDLTDKGLKDLKIFSNFCLTGLKELSIENCPFEGSLEHLKGLGELKRIFISHTNIGEGLEKLPKSCQEIYCDFHYQTKNKSVNIVKELGKHLELGEDERGTRYYNLEKWREEKRGGVAVIIPLERLYIIRSNIKKYVDKWGIKKDEDNNNKNSKLKNFLTWPYDKIIELWKKDESNLSELSKLKDPQEFRQNWGLITGIQWTNRAALVVGGGLVFVGQSDTSDPHSQTYTQIGGVIAIASPFVETITSYINDQIYDARQKRWDEFIENTKSLLDNYHELVGMINPVEIGGDLGSTKEALDELKEEIQKFLNEYDKEKDDGQRNGMIDIDELTEQTARKRFAEDLAKEKRGGEGSQLGNIIKAINELESAITNYRQTLYSSMNETEIANKKAKQKINNFLERSGFKPGSSLQGGANWKKRLDELKDPEEINKFSQSIIKEWEETIGTRGRTKLMKKWMDDSGLNSSDSELAAWLFGVKSEENEEFINPALVKENLESLKEEHKNYLANIEVITEK